MTLKPTSKVFLYVKNWCKIQLGSITKGLKKRNSLKYEIISMVLVYTGKGKKPYLKF